jgi:hypothetical protein
MLSWENRVITVKEGRASLASLVGLSDAHFGLIRSQSVCREMALARPAMGAPLRMMGVYPAAART